MVAICNIETFQAVNADSFMQDNIVVPTNAWTPAASLISDNQLPHVSEKSGLAGRWMVNLSPTHSLDGSLRPVNEIHIGMRNGDLSGPTKIVCTHCAGEIVSYN